MTKLKRFKVSFEIQDTKEGARKGNYSQGGIRVKIENAFFYDRVLIRHLKVEEVK